MESLHHAGFETGNNINILWVDSERVTEQNAGDILINTDGILIPGGFGDRGIDGKIAACKYAREMNIPFLGICLGMQIAVIEYARNVCNLKSANSTEFDKNSPFPVIDIMQEQIGIANIGGTMRLGAYPCCVASDTMLESLYGEIIISERHRHRYELNNTYRDKLTKSGLAISGTSPDNTLVEAIELPTNDFFIGVQFHPEFKSRPNKSHPLFLGLVKAAKKYSTRELKQSLLEKEPMSDL